MQLHYHLLSPRLSMIEHIATTILDENITPIGAGEISYRETVIKVKEFRISFRAPDIADLAASYLYDMRKV